MVGVKRNNILDFLIPFLFFWVTQIVFFYLIYKTGHFIWDNFVEQVRRNINWGITVRVALYLFIFFSFITTFSFVKKNRYRWLISIIVFVTFELIFINNFSYTPNRYILLSISAFIGFYLPLSILTLIQNRQ